MKYLKLLKRNFIIVDNLNLSENIKGNMIPGDNHSTKECNSIVANEFEKRIKINKNE